MGSEEGKIVVEKNQSKKNIRPRKKVWISVLLFN